MQSTSEGRSMRDLSLPLLFSLLWLICAAAVWNSQVVVSNRYENLNTQLALTNVPVTFSRIGADGHFTKGITPMIASRKLLAQVNMLRQADDGSIRHALVSLLLTGNIPALIHHFLALSSSNKLTASFTIVSPVPWATKLWRPVHSW